MVMWKSFAVKSLMKMLLYPRGSAASGLPLDNGTNCPHFQLKGSLQCATTLVVNAQS